MNTTRNSILSYLIDDAVRMLRSKEAVMSKNSTLADSIPYKIEAFTDLKNELKKNPCMSISQWHILFQTCHELYSFLGAIRTADHWQSPSFAGINVDEVGDEQRHIIANLNDYKRDQHPLGVTWEQAYANAYLTRSFVSTPKAFATTSGMAALTVAALVIRTRLPESYRIAIGVHSYFENKELLHMMFPGATIKEFEEDDPETLKAIQPNAIFFDILANDPTMTVAHVSGIFGVAGRMNHHVDVVVDTTCASAIHFRMPKIMRNFSVIGFESLNKYHQFGLDRTTAGVCWAVGISEDTLYRVRDHAGVNIPEIAAASLPTPNRAMHAVYLRQLEMNALSIAQTLVRIPGIKVSYPGLVSHPGHALAKKAGHFGSFVAVEFLNKSWQQYRKAMQKILIEAKKGGVPIVAGSTFGTPVTRIYSWTPRSAYEKPFLRISAGLEAPSEITWVGEVLGRALL